MNMFTVQILQILLNSIKVEVAEMLERLGLTRRMLIYYQKQLNDFLREENLGEVRLQDETLHLVCADRERLKEWLEHFDLDRYYLEAKERQECILIKIGIADSPQILEGLAEEFRVSRRTLSNDLTLLKEYLNQYGISLVNQQKKGYYLEGDEMTIRYLILSAYHNRENICIDRIKKSFLTELYHRYCGGKEPELIFEKIRQIVMGSEAYSNGKFVYFSLPDLAQTLLLVYLRSRKRTIEYIPDKEEIEPFGGMDYVEKKLEKLSIVPEGLERIYFELVLQAAQLSKQENGKQETVITELVSDLTEEFKRVSGLKIESSSELFEMFRIHVHSMYYRTRYRIKITNFYASSADADKAFVYLTRRVMDAVSPKYQLIVDDDEIRFMSYYFCCMVKQEKPTFEDTREKIVIVCVSGLGTSAYIRYQVLKLLDKSYSVVISDLRNLKNVLDEHTRLILTTLSLDSRFTKGIRVIRVSTILTSQNKQELIDWLLHEEVYLKNYGTVSDVLSIVKNYAVIQDQENLFQKLNKYFCVDMPTKTELCLEDLITVDQIQIFDGAMNWHESIEKAAFPLVDQGWIQEEYVKDIQEVLEKHGPYCEFLNGVLLAHAEPAGHVHRPVLSLAVFRSPVQVPEWNREITAVFILGVVDLTSHATALSELITNLSRKEQYKTLNQLNNREEIYRVLIGK